MHNQKYFNAIGFDANNKAYKYRNIPKNDRDKKSFENFCTMTKHNKLPFVYVNYYDAATKEYSHRVYFN